MSHQLFKLPRQLNYNGNLTTTPGGKAYFYQSGTTTPQDVYQDADLTVPHANPVVADFLGLLPAIYMNPGLRYKLTLKTSADVDLYTSDPINDQIPPTYTQTAAEVTAGVTPVDYSYAPGEVLRTGVEADGTTDDTAAFSSAIIADQAHVRLPIGTVRITSQISKTGISNISIIGSGKDSIIDARELGDTFAFSIQGTATDISTLSVAATQWAQSITLASTTGLAVGDLIELDSTEVVHEPTDHTKHEFQIVDSLPGGGVVNLKGGLYFDYSITGQTVTVRKINPVSNITFENFTLLMNGSANEQQGINVLYGRNVKFLNVDVIDAHRDGIKATRCYDVLYQGCTVRGTRSAVTGYGMYSSYSDNVIFTGNRGFGNRHSIEMAAGNNILVIGNQCEWDLSQGISTHGGTNYVSIIGNMVSHCGGGIRNRGLNCTIRDNDIIGFLGNQGISIGEEGTYRRGGAATNLLCVGNRIIASTGSAETTLDGIYVVNEVADSRIDDNDIWAGRHGILLNGYRVINSDFSRNRVHLTDNSGVGLRARMTAAATQEGSVMRNVQHSRFTDNWFGTIAGAALDVGSDFSDGEQEGVVIARNHYQDVTGRGCELTGSFNGPVIVGNTGVAGTRNIGASSATFDTRNPLIADNVNHSASTAQIGVTSNTDASGNASITFLRPLPIKPFIWTAIENATPLLVSYTLSSSGGKYTGATFKVTTDAGANQSGVGVRYRIEYYNSLSNP